MGRVSFHPIGRSKAALPCTAFLLALCSCAPGPAANPGDDYRQIMTAVLAAQSDVAAQREDWLREHPEERGWLSGLLDHRSCVAAETAGTAGDFDLETGCGVTEADRLSRTWEASPHRNSLSGVPLPGHLRWSRALSPCPSGLLRFGNPIIEGDTARVFAEKRATFWCGGFCGWGAEITLRKRGGRWIYEGSTNWWVS
jgi:hypothetical protein